MKTGINWIDKKGLKKINKIAEKEIEKPLFSKNEIEKIGKNIIEGWNKHNKNIVEIKKIGGSYFLKIPSMIVKMHGLNKTHKFRVGFNMQNDFILNFKLISGRRNP